MYAVITPETIQLSAGKGCSYNFKHSGKINCNDDFVQGTGESQF